MFFKGLFKMPLIWQIWVGLLSIINGVIPLFFLHEKVAVITLVSVFVGAAVAEVLTRAQGFTKLLGLMHGPWVPMFVMQIIVLTTESPTGNFKYWLVASVTVTAISLALDAIDIAKYLNGDKQDLLSL